MPEKYIYRSKSQMKEYYQQFLSLFSDVAFKNGFIKKGRGFYRVYGDNMLQFVRLNRNRGMMPSEIFIECDARWLFDLPVLRALKRYRYGENLFYSYAPGALYGASEDRSRHTLESLIYFGNPSAEPFPAEKNTGIGGITRTVYTFSRKTLDSICRMHVKSLQKKRCPY